MQTSDPAGEIVRFFVGIGNTVLAVRKVVITAVELAAQALQQAEDNERAIARDNALALRDRWKGADRPGLKSLGIEAQPKGRGLALVKPYQPLSARFVRKMYSIQRLYAPETCAFDRLRLLRAETPWFNVFAESLYRGEHQAARDAGVPGPSEIAYKKAARCLMMSPDLLQKICQAVRDDRRISGEEPEPMLLVEHFELWKATGSFPENLHNA